MAKTPAINTELLYKAGASTVTPVSSEGGLRSLVKTATDIVKVGSAAYMANIDKLSENWVGVDNITDLLPELNDKLKKEVAAIKVIYDKNIRIVSNPLASKKERAAAQTKLDNSAGSIDLIKNTSEGWTASAKAYLKVAEEGGYGNDQDANTIAVYDAIAAGTIFTVDPDGNGDVPGGAIWNEEEGTITYTTSGGDEKTISSKTVIPTATDNTLTASINEVLIDSGSMTGKDLKKAQADAKNKINIMLNGNPSWEQVRSLLNTDYDNDDKTLGAEIGEEYWTITKENYKDYITSISSILLDGVGEVVKNTFQKQSSTSTPSRNDVFQDQTGLTATQKKKAQANWVKRADSKAVTMTVGKRDYDWVEAHYVGKGKEAKYVKAKWETTDGGEILTMTHEEMVSYE
tara:strand:+ start:4431 stop:5639 length:1209 start_codon:yes stop_codon:yes gene_type:complete